MICETTQSLNRASNTYISSLLAIKGAPDILIDRCSHVVANTGSVEYLTEDVLTHVKALKDRWSGEGKRVILLARKVISRQDIMSDPSSREFEAEMMTQARAGLILVGLVGIVDPPREEIPEVVKILRRAGIRIFMVWNLFYHPCTTNFLPCR